MLPMLALSASAAAMGKHHDSHVCAKGVAASKTLLKLEVKGVGRTTHACNKDGARKKRAGWHGCQTARLFDLWIESVGRTTAQAREGWTA